VWLRLLLAALVVFALVFVCLQFSKFRRAANQTPPLGQITIQQPLNGSQVEAGESQLISALAIGPTLFTATELWVNGELVGAQANPISEGSNPLASGFSWIPGGAGAYSLVARAVDVDGVTLTSPAVLVIVAEGEGLGAGTFAPGAVGANLLPPAGDEVAEAQNWNAGLSDWAASLSVDSVPAAPELAVEAQECAVLLSIHDLSDNEAGFRIYRQASSAAAWQEIALLEAQSQSEWISYLDASAGGGNSYYAAAFNSAGEMQSNLAAVNVAAECSEAGAAMPVVEIEIESLSFENPPEELYCYRALNDEAWTRWPESGFFDSADGEFGQGEILQLLADDGGIDLQLECWGWTSGALDFLGSLEFHTLSNESGNFEALGDGVAAEVGVKPQDLITPIPLGEFESGIEISPFAPIYDELMPKVHLGISADVFTCLKFTPPTWQASPWAEIYCRPYPGLQHLGIFWDGITGDSQKYLTWDALTCAQAGCEDYAWWLAKAAAEGGKLGFEIKDWSNVGSSVWRVDFPELRAFPIPLDGCTGYRFFTVRLTYQIGIQTFAGPVSNLQGMYCNKIEGSELAFEVTFERLILEQDMGLHELFGYFVIEPFSGPAQYLNIATWNKKAAQCPDEKPQVSDPSFTSDVLLQLQYGCPQFFALGSNNMNPRYMCPAEKFKCSSGAFHLASNIAQFAIQDAGGFVVRMAIFEWNNSGPHRLICSGISAPVTKTVFDWQIYEAGEQVLEASAGLDAGCAVGYSVEVLK
jgi:hypothetical protein